MLTTRHQPSAFQGSRASGPRRGRDALDPGPIGNSRKSVLKVRVVYFSGARIRPRLVWENVQDHLVLTQEGEGYVIFDDTVLDKRHARKMALVRRQYSGNAQGVINGIGVVPCVYVNPVDDRFWLIDYRIYDPQGDGKTKLDHVQEMLSLLCTKNTCLSKRC